MATTGTVVAGVAAASTAEGLPRAVADAPPSHGVVAQQQQQQQQQPPRPRARPGFSLQPRPKPVVRRVVRGKHRPIPVVHGPVAPNTARETVADAEQSTVNDPGKCLQWAREQAGIPSGAATAATAWEVADVKRRGDTTPPPGAAVYWTGGSRGFGHVAISVGHGRVRSSDAGGIGEVATVPVGWISREWGLRYAGWSNSINGYAIPGLPAR